MTYKEFRDKWLGKGIDFDGAYGNQCMDVYRQYVKEVLGFPQSPPVTGAKDVWNTYLPEYFDRIDNTPEAVPQEGDIVIWNVGQYGHIAIFDHGSVSTLTCFEQNWTELDGSGVTELRRHGYQNILGWLRAKVVEDDTSDDERRALEAVKKQNVEFEDSSLEGTANAGGGARKDLQRIEEENNDLKASQDILTNSIEEKNLLLNSQEKKIERYQRDLQSANKKYQEIDKERRDWKRLYEAKCQETADKLTNKELFKLLVNRLFPPWQK